MILNISFIISANIRKVAAVDHAVFYHAADKIPGRIAVLGNAYYHTIALSHALLLEHRGRIYVKKIPFVVRKRDKQTRLSYAACHLPFDG